MLPYLVTILEELLYFQQRLLAPEWFIHRHKVGVHILIIDVRVEISVGKGEFLSEGFLLVHVMLV